MKKLVEKWENILSEYLDKTYYKNLVEFIGQEYNAKTVYPPEDLIFNALDMVSYDEIKVVILGQDPYHGEGQANGIAFAVNNGIALPPSLINIYKEIESDIGITPKNSGTLEGWAKQGVLLLNTSLTVIKATPQSHSSHWAGFSDAVISACSNRAKPMVFILWGANAIGKRSLINSRHCIISSSHPSPLSCYRGFFGSKCFSRANEFLINNGETPIDWTDTDGEKKHGKIIRV